jgi:hypothetical protein
MVLEWWAGEEGKTCSGGYTPTETRDAGRMMIIMMMISISLSVSI